MRPKEARAAPPRSRCIWRSTRSPSILWAANSICRTDITLQVADQAEIEAFKLHMPRIRSRLLTLLSSKQADELATAADKKKLAQEILAQVKQPFDPSGKPQQVDDVLFTSFIIQ